MSRKPRRMASPANPRKDTGTLLEAGNPVRQKRARPDRQGMSIKRRTNRRRAYLSLLPYLPGSLFPVLPLLSNILLDRTEGTAGQLCSTQVLEAL